MSELLQRIRKDQLEARKVKDTPKIKILTSLLGDVTPSGNATTNDNLILKVIKNNIKVLGDVIDIKKEKGVASLEEETFIEILSEYLPKQLSRDELQTIVDRYTEENNINSAKEIGKVMGYLNKTYPSKFDGKMASDIVKAKLS